MPLVVVFGELGSLLRRQSHLQSRAVLCPHLVKSHFSLGESDFCNDKYHTANRGLYRLIMLSSPVTCPRKASQGEGIVNERTSLPLSERY